MEAQFEPSFRTDLDDFSPLSPLSKDLFWVAPSSGRKKRWRQKLRKNTAMNIISMISWLVVSTHLKNISQIGSFPQVRVKIKSVWNHYLGRIWQVLWGKLLSSYSRKVLNLQQKCCGDISLEMSISAEEIYDVFLKKCEGGFLNTRLARHLSDRHVSWTQCLNTFLQHVSWRCLLGTFLHTFLEHLSYTPFLDAFRESEFLNTLCKHERHH